MLAIKVLRYKPHSYNVYLDEPFIAVTKSLSSALFHTEQI